MALAKKIETRTGLTARYHRIIGHEVQYIPEAAVEGCKGNIYVHVASYASKAARDAGAEPLGTTTVRIRFGAQIKGTIRNREREVPVLAIRSDEPTRAEIYEALLGSPTFAGGLEA